MIKSLEIPEPQTRDDTEKEKKEEQETKAEEDPASTGEGVRWVFNTPFFQPQISGNASQLPYYPIGQDFPALI